jgi:hypothetical protein
MILRDHIGTQILTAHQVFKIETVNKSDDNTKPPYGTIRRDRFDYTASKSDSIISKISRGNEYVSLEFNGVIQSVIEHMYVASPTNLMKDMKVNRPIYHTWDDIITNELLNDFINEITGKAPDILDGLDDYESLDDIPDKFIRDYHINH